VFVYSSSYLVFVVSVTQTIVVRVSCCLEYILYVTVRLLGLSSAKFVLSVFR